MPDLRVGSDTALPQKEGSSVNRSLIFLIVAIVCAVIFTLMGFDVISSDKSFGWLGLAVTFGLASRVP